MGEILSGIAALTNDTTAGSGSLGLSQLALQSTISQNQLQLQMQEWMQQQADSAPYLNAGTNAVNVLNSVMNGGNAFGLRDLSKFSATFTPNDFLNNKDPGYQWNMDQGTAAINAAGAASGNYGSGNMGAALQKFGQGLASQEYNNAFNRYQTQETTGYNQALTKDMSLYNAFAGLAGTGQTAVNQLAQGGQNYANNATATLGNYGNNASSIMQNMYQNNLAGRQNSWNQGMSAAGGAGNMLQQYYLMNMLKGGGYYNQPDLSLNSGMESSMGDMGAADMSSWFDYGGIG